MLLHQIKDIKGGRILTNDTVSKDAESSWKSELNHLKDKLEKAKRDNDQSEVERLKDEIRTLESGGEFPIADAVSSFGTKSFSKEELIKKAKQGEFEFTSDPKPRQHIEIRYPDGKREMVWVEDAKMKDWGPDFVTPLPQGKEVKITGGAYEGMRGTVVMGGNTETRVKVDGGNVTVIDNKWLNTLDSKMKDSVSILTSQGDYDVEIMDSTHLKFKLKGRDNWATPLHFNQVPEEMMSKLKDKGLVEGNFFKDAEPDPDEKIAELEDKAAKAKAQGYSADAYEEEIKKIKETKDDAYTENRISSVKKEIEKVKEKAQLEGGYKWNTRNELDRLEGELKQLEGNRKTSNDSKSEEAYDEGYEAALAGKPSSANPYTDVSKAGYADLKDSWNDGHMDGQKEVANKVFKKDSKTKDRQFDLGSGTLGNGITVWNRAREIGGDYERIAHIGPDRKVTWYISSPPSEVVSYVNGIVNGPNMAVSTSQPYMKVFNDSKMKDDLTQPLSVEEIKFLFQNIDPAYAKMLSGVVTSKQMAVQKGLAVGLKLSSEGMQFKDSRPVKDDFTSKSSLQTELEYAKEDLRKSEKNGDARLIKEAQDYVDQVTKAIREWKEPVKDSPRDTIEKKIADIEDKLDKARQSKNSSLIAQLQDELDKLEEKREELSEDSSDVLTLDPLTAKGEKIMENMKEQYGEKKGEQVFYASRNKGTIGGVDPES
jgi:hypothetical protein